MPRYDYICGRCGAQYELVQTISEMERGEQIGCVHCDGVLRGPLVLRSPAMHGFEGGGGSHDAFVYRQHNVTHPEQLTTAEGTVAAKPVPDALQCGCGNCSAHRKRNSVTDVASPTKAV